MSKTVEQLADEVAALEKENALLRRTIAIQQEQMRRGGHDKENRRLRAKIAEWEGSMPLMNGGYYHGARFIRPFVDNEDV